MQDNHTKSGIYTNDQVRAAVQELFNYEDFLAGMEAFIPPELNKLILSVTDTGVESAEDFQRKVIRPFLKTVEESSISNLTFSGIEHLSPDESYLFISNHRDIVLDSAYMNIILLEQGMRTSQIAIGDNLVANRLTELLFKINKSFVVKRTGSPREIYKHAVTLSQYIKDTVTQKEDSIWIAQREGRAKDGNDQTQISLLKMLSLANKKDPVQHFKSLNITPVSISYEYDPCGYLKTKEYLDKKSNPNYKKVFNDDAQHLLLGIKGYKGHVHFHFEKPLNKRLDILEKGANSKEVLQSLAVIIDKAIHLNFKLNPINYYAHDQLSGSDYYNSQYSGREKELEDFFEILIEMLPLEEQIEGRAFMLKIYANPLYNKLSYR